jgi:hypothetical protein
MRDLFGRRRQDPDEQEDQSSGVVRPPTHIDRLLVPEAVLQQTLVGIALGRTREMLCYWIGTSATPAKDTASAIVTTAAFPKVYSTYDHFHVLEGQMGLITTWCASRGLWVLAQVHSHPTDEPHSEADETWPASQRRGFLSVVFPFFAQHSSVHTPHWRAYESLGNGNWQRIDPGERFEILPSVWLPRE